jgi:hypothetical protein
MIRTNSTVKYETLVTILDMNYKNIAYVRYEYEPNDQDLVKCINLHNGKYAKTESIYSVISC